MMCGRVVHLLFFNLKWCCKITYSETINRNLSNIYTHLMLLGMSTGILVIKKVYNWLI